MEVRTLVAQTVWPVLFSNILGGHNESQRHISIQMRALASSVYMTDKPLVGELVTLLCISDRTNEQPSNVSQLQQAMQQVVWLSTTATKPVCSVSSVQLAD